MYWDVKIFLFHQQFCVITTYVHKVMLKMTWNCDFHRHFVFISGYDTEMLRKLNVSSFQWLSIKLYFGPFWLFWACLWPRASLLRPSASAKSFAFEATLWPKVVISCRCRVWAFRKWGVLGVITSPKHLFWCDYQPQTGVLHQFWCDNLT